MSDSGAERIQREREFFADWTLNPAGDRLRWQRELRLLRAARGSDSLGHVLSIGCGRGQFEQMLAPHARQVLGIDLSPETVEDARREADRAGVTNIRFECADVAGFEFDQMFDTVVCIGFLHHLSDPESLELLSRIYRHLHPGGLVHTQDPNIHGVLRHLGRLLLGNRYNDYHTPDERELDPESVRNIFLQAGFGEARVRHMDLSLIPGMQMLPNAPQWIMRILDLLDRVWCAGPAARWGSGFVIDAVR